MNTLEIVNAYVAVRRAQGVRLNSSARVLRQFARETGNQPLSESSSKLPWSGLSCSLRLANLCRLRMAISWASCSLTVSRRWIFWPMESTWDSS